MAYLEIDVCDGFSACRSVTSNRFYRFTSKNRMADPSGCNYLSLAEAEAAVLEYAAANGASVNRAWSKKDKKGAVHKVWLSCVHAGEYKNHHK